MGQMKTIYVKTTGTCNLNCDHCFTNGKKGDKTQFDPEVTAAWIKDFMSHYDDQTHYHFEFHGGEPFLVPVAKLEHFASLFDGRPESISMCGNSNLTFKLTDEIIEFMERRFDKRIGTSWDHWIRWDNEKQFALWRKNLQLLKARGFYIGLKVSVSKQMVAADPDWVLDQLESFEVDSISLERLTIGGNSHWHPDIFPDNTAQDEWYLALLKRYQERKPKCTISTLDTLVRKIRDNVVKADTNCRNCEQNLVTINSNGTLGGCPNMAIEHRHATIEESAQEFLISDGRVNEIAAELDFKPNCTYCDVFDLCGGDCHRLPWQGDRCGGLKHTLRYLSGRTDPQLANLIFKG